MKNNHLKASLAGQIFMLHPSVVNSLVSLANSRDVEERDDVTVREGSTEANNSVETEIIHNVGIVTTHGAMYKKRSAGLCMSVLSYSDIFSSIKMMEEDDSIDTIINIVDTPGGVVASGADDVADLILNSKKRTITLYDNQASSGGMWIFSASKEIYATNLTQLGSVGVKGGYLNKTEDNGVVELVSANAENKDCSLNGTCKEKALSILNKVEDEFYVRLEKNTGHDKNFYIDNFNKGDTIFADKALEIGFLDGISTRKELLEKVVTGAVPAETKPAKINTRTTSWQMEKT